MYIGPDALMPIASVFAAVAGFVMMFWRRLVALEIREELPATWRRLVGAVKMLFAKFRGGEPQQNS